MTLGSGASGELTLLDIITLVSFYIGLENLEMNITQEDVQEATDKVLNEIHTHLEEQDRKIDLILGVLNENHTDIIRENRRRNQ